MSNTTRPVEMNRRAFLKQGTLILTAAGLTPPALLAADATPRLKIGLLTDLHYADKAAAGSRYYRETPGKLEEAAERFAQSRPDFLVELGDLIDAADNVAVEQRYLKTINQQFAAICPQRYYVLGNHCVDTLTKAEFLAGVEQQRSYFSFDQQGFHFIVLDSCFRSDGVAYGRKNSHWTDAYIPTEERDWLQQDLADNRLPVVVFAHQRLDVSNHHGVKNQAKIRQLLDASGNVLAVFQGHSHKNDLNFINGIPFCTLAAMIEGTGAENNSYSLLEIAANGTLQLTGFRSQQSYEWKQPR